MDSGMFGSLGDFSLGYGFLAFALTLGFSHFYLLTFALLLRFFSPLSNASSNLTCALAFARVVLFALTSLVSVLITLYRLVLGIGNTR
jgi:hypothetical protein